MKADGHRDVFATRFVDQSDRSALLIGCCASCSEHLYPLRSESRGGSDPGWVFPRLSQGKGSPGLVLLPLGLNQLHSTFCHVLSTEDSLAAQQESQAKIPESV